MDDGATEGAPIFAKTINTTWTVFKWGGALLVLAALAIVPYVYSRIDDMVRSEAERCLAERVPNARVRVGEAELVEGRGVLLRDVLLADRQSSRDELIRVEEVFLACRADWESLLRRDIQITSVKLQSPTVHLTRRRDGRWNLESLLANNTASPSCATPPIEILDGRVVLSDATSTWARPTEVTGIRMHIAAPRADGGREVTTFEGQLTSPHAESVEFRGEFAPATGDWTLSGAVARLALSPSLAQSFPMIEGSLRRRLQAFRAEVDASFSAARDAKRPNGFRLQLTGDLRHGRYEDDRLEHPLNDVRGRFELIDNVLTIRQLQASYGETSIELACRKWDCFHDGPAWVSFEAGALHLDDGLKRMLPEEFHEAWTRFQPSGRVRLGAELQFDGKAWKPLRADVDCEGVGFVYDRYPLPVEQGQGRIALARDGRLTIVLDARMNNQPLHIEGTLLDATGPARGVIHIDSPKLTINDRLLGALSPGARDALRELQPTGSIGLHATVARQTPGRPFELSLDITLRDVAIQYEKFPYPITRIGGRLVMRNDDWTIEDLTGSNGGATLEGRGRLASAPTGGRNLDLYFDVKRLPLQEELRDAFLDESVHRLWNDMKLRGMTDAHIEIHYRSGKPGIGLTFTATPYPDTTSIQPMTFPYRLEQLRGVLQYRDGQVTIRDMRAEHGEVRFASNVTSDFHPDGSWRVSFDDLIIDQIRVDREFLETAPDRLQSAIAPLQLDGPVNLSGRAVLSKQAGSDRSVRSDWDMTVTMHQVNANIGVPVKGVSGGVRMQGCQFGDFFYCTGLLDIDSLVYEDVQMTNIGGPFRLNERGVLLGRSTPLDAESPCRFPPLLAPLGTTGRMPPVEAKLFGGKITIDGWVLFDALRDYRLWVDLQDADLRTLARELAADSRDMRGQVQVTAEISGRGRDLRMLQANGSASLRRADIQQAPFIVALLQSLPSNRERTAFGAADAKFYVHGGRIDLNQIALHGNAVSLEGRGEMDFERNVDLQLGTRLGRGDGQTRVLRDVLGAAGEQFFVIDVKGPLSDPEITRRPFPALREALDQIRGDQPIPNAAPATIGGAAPVAPPMSGAAQTKPFWQIF